MTKRINLGDRVKHNYLGDGEVIEMCMGISTDEARRVFKDDVYARGDFFSILTCKAVMAFADHGLGREIIRLRYTEGRSWSEISLNTGIPERTLQDKVQRCFDGAIDQMREHNPQMYQWVLRKVGKVAKELGRRCVLVDISEEYCRLAVKRVQGVSMPMMVDCP